jgi:hypothetical protein
MNRYYFESSVFNFLKSPDDEIIGRLVVNNEFDLGQTQRDAWIQEISVLKKNLRKQTGHIFLEYSIPRMGMRIDAICIIGNALFVIEFKVGEKQFQENSIDQVMDYALDLKNFHKESHNIQIVPVLICTKTKDRPFTLSYSAQNDKLALPILTNGNNLEKIIDVSTNSTISEYIDIQKWSDGGYSPTPTIVEAALALYRGHSVEEISRKDAGAKNLYQTTKEIRSIIELSRKQNRKSICFITGVPGAGKTLVGLDIATRFMDKSSDDYSVYLSGNGPLVKILCEALARDQVDQEKSKGKRLKIGEARSKVKVFIQNVHHFRDEYLIDKNSPTEHVAIFDEAQRAWTLEKTSDFMRRKKNQPNFFQSESEFLISCLNRHIDWAVIVCLVGGGQEINTGEAGIGEWFNALNRSFSDWDIYLSSKIVDSEYGNQQVLEEIYTNPKTKFVDDLHLSVSMRSYRAEKVSLFIKQLLDLENESARTTLSSISSNYPIILTRSISKAKEWLKSQARGTERYGIIVSSQAERLRPHAINVKSPMDPIHWFLDKKDDVRSSYYLEDVATEFDIQGLELDWACITWDGDFRYSNNGWKHYAFVGNRWNNINKTERKLYQKNAYRVLLTRARQGMIIVVPEGDNADPTRKPEYYDLTFEYLMNIGIPII